MQQSIKGEQVSKLVFTPLTADGRTRLRFKRSDVTILKGDLSVRRLGWQALVRIGSTVYNVIGCPCDLEGCNCDAFIEPVQRPEIAA